MYNSVNEIILSRAGKLYSLLIAFTPIDNQPIDLYFLCRREPLYNELRLFLGQGIPPYFHPCCLTFDRVAVGTIFKLFGMIRKFESIYISFQITNKSNLISKCCILQARSTLS